MKTMFEAKQERDSKQKFSLGYSVMFPMEMTREALRQIFGCDLQWAQTDIVAEPVFQARSMFEMYEEMLEEEYRCVLHDEVARIVHIKTWVGQVDGKYIKIESQCWLYNNQCMWEPEMAKIKIGEVTHELYYQKKWENDRWVSTCRLEKAEIEAICD
ncbi:MAG: hypothetical protein COS97_02770 [Candidatus Nealsonbacteria bacterium CG07_land_8_20_14_0_80_40_10]|nr:MAG: hypothetical protein COS97_02770 [Candidatus Nealsonbacteria bacterium CG07_land_8_20_14_0_80_40_10]